MSEEAKPNAFSADFLRELEQLVPEPASAFHAAWAGPWRVEKRGKEYAVLRESDGRVEAMAEGRDLAELLAVALSISASKTRYCFERNREDDEFGIDLKVIREVGGFTTVAKLRSRLEHITDALKMLEKLLLLPQPLAYLLDAASPDYLNQAGALLMLLFQERIREEAEPDSAADLPSEDSEDDSGTPEQKQVTK